MSQHGATLQCYNQELVKCLEEMKLRRLELQAQIDEEEEEKRKLQIEIDTLTQNLTRLNDSLTKKRAVRDDYDQTIAETEHAYSKILESSQLLLDMVKKGALSLDQTLNKNNEKRYPQ